MSSVWVRAAMLGLLFVGCASSPPPASPQLRCAAAEVLLLDGPPVPPHRKLRQVETIACARELAEAPDMAAARQQLKIEGARAGANAVGNIMCHEEDAGAARDCWKIARCTGDAYCASRASNWQVVTDCDLGRR